MVLWRGSPVLRLWEIGDLTVAKSTRKRVAQRRPHARRGWPNAYALRLGDHPVEAVSRMRCERSIACIRRHGARGALSANGYSHGGLSPLLAQPFHRRNPLTSADTTFEAIRRTTPA